MTSDKTKQSTKCFREEVDISKVNKILVKRWIIDRLEKHVPDDDIAVEFVYELLVGADNGKPDVKVIRQYMDEILGEESTGFCIALWQMLLSAQKSKNGVPQELIEERMAAMSKAEGDGNRREGIEDKHEKAESKDRESKINPENKNLRGKENTESGKSNIGPGIKTYINGSKTGVDEKALQEAQHILQLLRPKKAPDTHKETAGRVRKPKGKTNYNRG